MDDGGRGHRPASLIEGDATVHPIHRSSDENAQDEHQQQPIFEGDIGGKGEEIEADVLLVQGIALAIRHLVDESQERVSVAHLPCGHQDPEQTGDHCDEGTPRETLARALQQLG
jgi:hypothetical protein